MRSRGGERRSRTPFWVFGAAALLAACGGAASGLADAGTSMDAAPEGSDGAGLSCGETTCQATWQFCMDSVSDAGEHFQCAALPAVCPCPATCSSLLGAYSSSNLLDRQPNPACLLDADASTSPSGSVVSVPLTCSTTTNGGLTLRGDTFPCGTSGGNDTVFCLSATEYCLQQVYLAGGSPSFGCHVAPAQCKPASCACLDAAGTFSNPTSSGSSSSGYGSPQWSCSDDGGVLATVRIP